MNQEKNKRNKQEKYLEFQMLTSQYQKLDQQLQNLEQQILELISLDTNLEDLSDIKDNTHVLVPFGAGILIPASINTSKNLLVNVGANTIVEKNIVQSRELIKKQIKELEKIQTQYQKEISKLGVSIQVLQKELT